MLGRRLRSLWVRVNLRRPSFDWWWSSSWSLWRWTWVASFSWPSSPRHMYLHRLSRLQSAHQMFQLLLSHCHPHHSRPRSVSALRLELPFAFVNKLAPLVLLAVVFAFATLDAAPAGRVAARFFAGLRFSVAESRVTSWELAISSSEMGSTIAESVVPFRGAIGCVWCEGERLMSSSMPFCSFEVEMRQV